MKKLLIVAMALMLAFSLAACGGNSKSSNDGNITPPSSSGNSSTPGTSQAGGNTGDASQTDGSDETTAPESDDQLLPENATMENWQQVCKEWGGFDVAVPEGWSVDSVEISEFGSCTITFTTTGAESAVTYGEALFAANTAAAVKAPYNANGDVPFANFADTTAEWTGEYKQVAGWMYRYPIDSWQGVRKVTLQWNDTACALLLSI
jgi:hypothetical protein